MSVVVDVTLQRARRAAPAAPDDPLQRHDRAGRAVGSRIAFERLVGTSWKVVGGTVASATTSTGVVGFAKTVRVHSGGFFRALVLPVEGAHVSGYSPVALVRIRVSRLGARARSHAASAAGPESSSRAITMRWICAVPS